MKLHHVDDRFFARTSESDHITVHHSEGSLLFDAQRKKYIDLTSGWCVGNVGWENWVIESRLRDFHGPTYVSPAHVYPPWERLALILARITPGRLKKTYRATGGTEAVEFALQAAILFTGRTKFVSVEGCYHGNSLATLMLGSSCVEKKFSQKSFARYQMKPPLDNRALKKLETQLKKRDIAAVIMEPVLLNLGVLIPSKPFMTELQALCRKYGTLLIMDEVATGFGRTGKLFATSHYDLSPDILCMGKAITGGYEGMGATIVTAAIADAIAGKTSFYSTYGWHPRSVEAALANIQFLLEHRKKLKENIAEMSEYFRVRLTKMFAEEAEEIRGLGMAIAVKLKNRSAAELEEAARKKGLLINSHGSDTLTFFPALNIECKVVEEGLDILESCVHKTHLKKAA